MMKKRSLRNFRSACRFKMTKSYTIHLRDKVKQITQIDNTLNKTHIQNFGTAKKQFFN